MSDTLRDRIAAAIEAQHVGEFQGGIHPEDVLRLAEAVIRELGMRRQSDVDGDDEPSGGYGTQHRYVTEWATDEIQ